MERSKAFNVSAVSIGKYPLLKHFLWLLLAAWIYTLTFIFSNYWSRYASYASVTSSFQRSLNDRHESFNDWMQDSARLVRLATGRAGLNDLHDLHDKPFQVFLYQQQEVKPALIFWSTNAVAPLLPHVNGLASGSFVSYGNGQYEFIKRRVQLNNKPYVVVALVLLHQEFFVENEKLQKEFPGFKGLGGKMMLTVKETSYPIVSEQGKTFAYFLPQEPEPIYIFNFAAFLVEFLVTLFIVIFISRFAGGIIHLGKPLQGIAFFITALLLLRWFIKEQGLPVDLQRLPLFNTGMAPSDSAFLKNLLLNALMGGWLSWFLFRRATSFHRHLSSLPQKIKYVLAGIIALGAATLHFKLILLIRTLYLDSSVSFDLTNFFSIDFTTLLSFMVLFLMSLMHYQLMRLMLPLLYKLLGSRLKVSLFVLTTAGLILLTFFIDRSYNITLLFSLLWLLLLYTLMCLQMRGRLPAPAASMVVGLFTYAFSLALLLSMLAGNRLKSQTFNLARNLLMQNDRSSEYEVKIAAGGVRKIDWAGIMANCGNPLTCEYKKDSIVNAYFTTYLPHYQTQLYLFDQNGRGYNKDGSTFESLNTLYGQQAVVTDFPGLSYYEESFDRFGYIFKHQIKDNSTGGLAGYLFVIARSSGVKNQAVAPELFRQLQDFAVDLPQGFSYAWYKHGVLAEQYRNFSFPVLLHMPKGVSQSLWENDGPETFELWMNAGSNIVLAIAAQRNIAISFISILAYLFGSFLFFYVLIRLAGFLGRGQLFSNTLWRRYTATLQGQIRTTLVSMLVVSFVIIAGITISFFVGQFRSGNEDRLAKTVQNIATDLTRKIPSYYNELSEDEKSVMLHNLLNNVTTGFNVDANCYDTRGYLLASTQDIFFEKGVLSRLVDPEAWWQLTKGQIHRYISKEKIGSLTYSSIYQPIRTSRNQLIGYLQVPYFASQTELNQEISNFLVILINIIAFVFLLSGGLAFWISGSITRSFDFIVEKMNRIQLSEHNERIEWHRNDEIGRLVEQYNKMVDQLEDSARKMAKNERELAWREMARQVAHEIKNPLTPMKLSLQFLQKAIQQKNKDVHQLTERVAGNLVEQIDHLTKIANDFSQFANLGNMHPESFDLHDTLRPLVHLYDVQDRVLVKWEALGRALPVHADKTQINRLFTNLIKNAVEAAPDDHDIEISIVETINANTVILSITDNGMGIPAEVQEKIFVPNFTTKSSGTGLGLAICKVIVENQGGAIWFTTTEGKGTTFFIQLPLEG